MENNALTVNLYNELKKSIENAESIDIIVSFLMESGVKLILNDLEKAIEKGVEIRIPQALFKYYPTQALYLLFSKKY